MFEKVNPKHPDKIADRIADKIVEETYNEVGWDNNPTIAVEVLIGHGECFIIMETSYALNCEKIMQIVHSISGNSTINVKVISVAQDKYLFENQNNHIRCGDNGIFKGMPITDEQSKLATIAKDIYHKYDSDGKYILDNNKLIICQSNASTDDLLCDYPTAIINPIGEWVGGLDVDSGATNRKLGSDMGDAVTGGGLHGKDFSKADVSINIYAHLKSLETNEPLEISCAIGDEFVDGKPYSEIVSIAKNYVQQVGFENFASWGLI